MANLTCRFSSIEIVGVYNDKGFSQVPLYDQALNVLREIQVSVLLADFFHKKLLLDTPQLAGGRKGASPRSGLSLVFFHA